MCGLAGCDLVLIDPPPEPIVRGTFVDRWVENDSEGRPVVLEAPSTPSGVTITARFEDGSAAVVEHLENGELAFRLPAAGAPYRLVFDRDGRVSEIQHTASTLQLVRRSFGRRDRVAVQEPTPIMFPAGNSDAIAVSTGVFTYTSLGRTRSLDWQLADSLAGSVGLLSKAAHDRLYFFERTLVGASLYLTLASQVEAQLEMVSGRPEMITGPLTPLAQDHCANINGQRKAAVERLAAITHYGASGSNWIIYAAPALDISPFGLPLAFDSAAPDVELDIRPRFAKPFEMPLVASMRVSSTRTYTYPGATSTSISASTAVFDRLNSGDDCVSNSVLMKSTIGIPGDIAVADQLVDLDGRAITLPPAGDVVVTWELASDGPVHDYIVSLLELVALDGTTTLRSIMTAATAERRAVFDRERFATGGYYLVRIDARLRNPGAPDGDYTAIVYPNEDASVHSRAFQVVP